MLVYHIDMNSEAFRPDVIRGFVRDAARFGYDAILWEIEDKVRFERAPEIAHPDAMTRGEFQGILGEAAALGLEAIPLMQTFGHGEYVMSHPEYAGLRENPGRSDCYCVSNPKVREFQMKLLHEYLEIFGDVRYFHLGGDEAWSFGTCPACSRRSRSGLYVEHLLAVSAELREKGVRPCCWGDMILGQSVDLMGDAVKPVAASLPRDFVIFDWKYGTGWRGDDSGVKSAGLLASLGFDVVTCCAVQSYGDDPFTVTYPRHAANVVALARLAGERRLLGFCVTCWSVRGACKAIAAPLFDLAARTYRGGGDADGRIADAVRREYFGELDETTLDDLTCGDYAPELSGVMWTGLKDSLPPPSGCCKSRFDELSAKDPERLGRMRRDIPGMAMRHRAAHAEAERRLPRTQFARVLLQASRIKGAMLEFAALLLAGERPDRAAVLQWRDDAREYYALEQTPHSARNYSEVVCNLILDATL